MTARTTIRLTRLAPGFYTFTTRQGSFDRYEVYCAQANSGEGSSAWLLTYPGCSAPDDAYATLADARDAIAAHLEAAA